MAYLHPDLHLHSTVSDGSDTPLELLEKVRQAGIDIFSLTDHDTYLGCDEIIRNLKKGDPAFLGGIELSSEDNFGKYHILGYCYNVNMPSIQKAAEFTHNSRRSKAHDRFTFLEEVHHFSFTAEEKETLLSNENPGKPHFAELLYKKGYVKDKKEGFAIMNEFPGKQRKLTAEEAIDAILQADGIPVLAHGIFEDGPGLLTASQMAERVKRLKGLGLMGLECYYSSYTSEQSNIMVNLAKTNNMLITAGSDYHGKNKTVALGQSGNPDPALMQRFYTAVHNLLGI